MLHTLPWWGALLVGLWIASNAIGAYTSGWSALARRFQSGSQPEGPRLTHQVVRVGSVRESRSTVMIPTAAGLYLHSHPLMFFRPPLLIPWSLIRYAGGQDFLWMRTRVLDLDGVTTIGVRDNAFREITPYLNDAQQAVTGMAS
ncbi:MAG TPA: hypothetical protein VFA43_18380 [Gemmatimonadaceae bacterium]|nr:hypothetical protein [Gemmatimonadaceae bacterium]